ncbi:tudor domain-containing protein 7 [Spea bombifrons]|uniref:tudor domain-containing protein 7 n=1 Tax=Spea bombifrons TaxID=233779 RepID=UPI0023498E69|nr:tudor domain-containing protein 7 [Spea bombifrons]
MLESEKDLVAKMLRAVLQANKNGVPLFRLQGEYKSLTGETIPFKEMGFQTLEAYLKAVPAVVKIDMNRAGEVVCHAVVCKETARIAELVARQRSSKRKSGGQVNCQMRLKYSAPVTHVGKPKATLRKPGFPSPQDRIIRKPVPSTAKVKGNVWGGQPPPDPYSPPPGALMYNAGISREVLTPRQPSITNRPERKVTLPPRFQKEGNSYLLPTTTVDSNANDTQSGKLPLLGSFYHNLVSVQNNLRDLFSKYSNGIWISKLPLLYKETFKQDLGEDVLKQVPAWTHICTAQKLMNGGQTEVILYPPIRKQTTPKTSPHRSSELIKQNISPVHSKPTPTPKQTPGTIPDAELKQKVSEILLHYPTGLWSRALPKVFEDTYRMKFPDEVLQNLSTLSDICNVDIISENPYKAILYAKAVLSEEQNMNLLGNMNVSQAIPKINQGANPSDTEDFDVDLTPPALVFPSEASPSVLVVELNDTNEVVIRYVGQGYSVAQERMEDEMKEFYSKSSSHVKACSLRVGQLVAVKAEEDAWLRAEVSTTDDNKIKVYYVDYGFSDLVEVIKVCRLAKQFYTLPFQATQCRLAGLEAFSKDPMLVKAVESKACGKILAVEILQKTEIPLVVLYDTSGDDDVNINASCLRELCDHSLSLQLKINSSYSNVIVTNVCSDGTLFCQVPSKGLAKLCETLQKIQSDFSSKYVTSDLFVNLPFCGKICLFHCKGKWARVEITSVHSSRALDVQFLDSGTIASVKVSELREIPSHFLRDIISIPPQALRCCLADLPLNIGTWTPDAVLWLRNTVLNCSDCSIKVVKMDETKNMVHVYLFSSKNCLDPEKSINRLITNEELWRHQKDVFISVNPGLPSMVNCKGDATSNMPGPRKEQTHITKKHIEEQNNASPCSEMPPPLPLPKPGEHIDVFVSVACHPGHFVFQPWQELHKLEVVMEEMLLHYSTTEEKPVALEKTKIYAAKIDNKWYRVLLKGILTNGLVSVYQLDYGRHELVNCRKVQPLLQKFRQLPFQAVTSQLAGIKCEQWSEEASIVFRNHVEKKPLVALIQAVYESTNPWDRKVVVYIVDTSMPDTDIWVHDLMSEYLDELSRSE